VQVVLARVVVQVVQVVLARVVVQVGKFEAIEDRVNKVAKEVA
jgi:hypothetical protein